MSRAVRALREVQELRSVAATDPRGARVAAVRLVTDVADGNGGIWYELGMVGGEPLPIRWHVHGLDDYVIRSQRDLGIPNPSGDPRLAPPSWNTRFLLLGSLLGSPDAFWQTRLYEQCWSRAGVRDQLRMAVYHRGEFIAWIGTLRRNGEPLFDRADLRRVAPLADALAAVLISAHHAERAGAPELGADLVLDPHGRLVAGTDRALDWAARPAVAAELRAWTRCVDRGEPAEPTIGCAGVRWSRLHERSGRVRYLLHLEPLGPVRRHPAHVLSRTQREVCRLAAAGATAREIGEMLALATTTVRTHLRQAYAALGVGTRAELVRALEELPAERQRCA